VQQWLGIAIAIAIAIAFLCSSSCHGITLCPWHYSLFCGIVFCTKVGQQHFSLLLFILLHCTSCCSVSLQVTSFFVLWHLACVVPWHWRLHCASCHGIGNCIPWLGGCILHHAMAFFFELQHFS